ncbi:polysaccharide deacetylase family protein [Gayadomonas joobiniege]|uniref:polysaccharide deacetylase family protein n=1 Tax=Gayadomonas joobiniege TaxID=1234606 RepID=UPI0003650DA9|nr:polysaccharide deacetylase family protein [Gayadomonas joobiniege]
MQTLKKLLVVAVTLLSVVYVNKEAYANPAQSELTRGGLVILQYHHVADSTPPVTSVTAETFRKHMQYLAEHNFNVVDLHSAIKKLKNKQALPANAVAITFDDGYLNLADSALPLLAEKGWPATIFVNPGLLQQHNQHYLSWQQLKEWQDKGMTIANHGWQHDYWVRGGRGDQKKWQARIKKSIKQTEKAIKKHLGSTTGMLAYPYGEYDTWIQDWIAEQGLIGFGQHSGAVSAQSNFTALPRYPASGNYADLETLSTKLMSEAFPMDHSHLPSPLVASEQNPPRLKLDLTAMKTVKHLNCFVSGAAKSKVESNGDGVFEVTADRELPNGRSRYNCTMATDKAGVFYWLSQLWLVYKPELQHD